MAGLGVFGREEWPPNAEDECPEIVILVVVVGAVCEMAVAFRRVDVDETADAEVGGGCATVTFDVTDVTCCRSTKCGKGQSA